MSPPEAPASPIKCSLPPEPTSRTRNWIEAMSDFRVTPEQKRFFDTFGYIVFPGLLADRIGEITRAFDEVWQRRGHVHDGLKRSAIVPFVDQHETLSALLEDPKIDAVGSALLGEDFNYMGSDGNYYVGDTPWHCDSFHEEMVYMKTALYLDPVTRDTGALRVIPGTHVVNKYREDLGPLVVHSQAELGVHGRDVPCVALESRPGDVVCFNHTTLHASFGGSNRRRMFTLDLATRHTERWVPELRAYLAGFGRKGLPRLYGEKMIAGAQRSPRRMRHLEQVMANDSHMAELARQAKEAGTAAYG